ELGAVPALGVRLGATLPGQRAPLPLLARRPHLDVPGAPSRRLAQPKGRASARTGASARTQRPSARSTIPRTLLPPPPVMLANDRDRFVGGRDAVRDPQVLRAGERRIAREHGVPRPLDHSTNPGHILPTRMSGVSCR